jgi:trehalose 6-phosphate phosphatase
MKLCAPLRNLLLESGLDRVFLFLDYDGTLAEFAPNPDIVLPDEELISLLKQLSNHKKMDLVILSGRRLGHIRELVPLTGLWLAGSYGVEMITPEGKEINLLDFEILRPRLEKIKPYWQSLVAGRDDFYLEDKGWSIAIHANGKDSNEVDQIIKKAEMINIPNGFILQGNDHFIELCPPEADKGKAVRYILESVGYQDTLPFFIGDDDRDESAFEEIQKMGGIGIVVSTTSIPSKAKFFLKDPLMVRTWLEEFLN